MPDQMPRSNGPVEPAADLRQMANFLHQTYVALTAEGFTEQQALVIIGQMLVANGGSSGGDSNEQ